jgi:phosphatidylserine/phosphatidylglycerophosphate/cardiolipin synthase-like enzyme
VDDDDRAYLRHSAFRMAQERLSADPVNAQTLEWLEAVVKVLLPHPAAAAARAEVYFSPGFECQRRIIAAFNEAHHTADVCVFTITDNEVGSAITRAHQRGVRIRIISDDDKSGDLGSDIDDLARQGIPVRTDDSEHHMHHKFAIFDGALVLSGSYNWTRSAAHFNQENITVSDDPRLVRRFAQCFEKLWREYGG